MVALQKTEEPSALSIWPNVGENVTFTGDVIVLDKILCLPIKLPHNKLLNPSWSAISPPTSTHFQTRDSAITSWASLVQKKRFWTGTFSDDEIFARTECGIGKGPESKLEMCFIYTLHTEPEDTFIQTFQWAIFQLWPITRNRCGNFHSQCPASSESFRFPIFRVERLDFYQTSPIHTGSPSLFEHREKQSNNTPCLSFKDGTVSLGEGEKTELPCCVQHETDRNHTTAGYPQVAQIKPKHFRQW